ncbi:MAG: hypothetical protein OXB86_02905 [Bdellovibrionales bacterium]|nr:hypothetical protein [Bdellovibrionales bacterium]
MASYPLTPEKFSLPSVTKVENYVKDHCPSPPWKNVETGILCFSPVVAEQIAQKFGIQGKRALGAKFYFFENQKTLLVSQFGIGAPAAVVQLEYLKVFSVKRVFSLGLAGGLSNKFPAGEKLFIQEAFRDEGCSHHYQATTASIRNSHIKTGKRLISQLNLKAVKSWTTDAPFRETNLELDKWIKHGLSCVEMEASALMTVADYYSLPLFCLAVLSDFIEKGTWQRSFSDPLVKKNLESLLESLLLDPIEK